MRCFKTFTACRNQIILKVGVMYKHQLRKANKESIGCYNKESNIHFVIIRNIIC